MHVRKDTKLNKTLGTGSIDRSARVRRIKRVLITLIALVILLPSVLCIILFAKLSKLEKQVIELSYEREKVNVITESTKLYEPKNASSEGTAVSVETIKIIQENELDADTLDDTEVISDTDSAEEDVKPTDERDSSDDSSEVEISLQDVNDNSNGIALKRVYLTFDDGPSSNTSKILDILNEYNVKGTFFVVGRLSDTTTPMYKRIVDEGHSIGMHSYTHKYNEVYRSVDSFVYDVEKIQSLIYEQTGVLSRLYRFPGGSSNTVSKTDISLLSQELDKRDIKYFDWNVVSGDASGHGISKEEIVKRCTAGALNQEDAIILMHDLPEKATTVAALPEIIEYFQSIGVEILPLDVNSAEVHHTINVTE